MGKEKRHSNNAAEHEAGRRGNKERRQEEGQGLHLNKILKVNLTEMMMEELSRRRRRQERRGTEEGCRKGAESQAGSRNTFIVNINVVPETR